MERNSSFSRNEHGLSLNQFLGSRMLRYLFVSEKNDRRTASTSPSQLIIPFKNGFVFVSTNKLPNFSCLCHFFALSKRSKTLVSALPLDPIFLRFRSFRFSFPRFDLNSCKNNNPNSIASQRNNVESLEKETKRT